MYSWKVVEIRGRVCYVLGMHIVYENASIIGYSLSWVVGEQFVCIMLLKMGVDFSEVVSCVHHANASTVIIWFHYN